MRSKDTEFAVVKLPQMPSLRGCESGVAKTLKRTYTQTHSRPMSRKIGQDPDSRMRRRRKWRGEKKRFIKKSKNALLPSNCRPLLE